MEAEIGYVIGAFEQKLRERAQVLMTDLFNQAGRAGAADFGKVETPIRQAKFTATLQFDAVNPRALDWVRKRAAKLVVEIGSQTRAAIRRLIQEAIQKGIPAAQSARLIEQVIGLDTVSADAVAALRERILLNPGKIVTAGSKKFRVPVKGNLAEFAAKKTQQYADRLLRFRAMRIARTEIIAASNAGQQELWQQAEAKGLLDSKVDIREWVVTPDDRLCPICLDLDGAQATLDGQFPEGLDGPPAHPMCRCSQVLVQRTR